MGKRISILGSTGSIGRNVLRVVEQFPERFTIVGLAAGRNVDVLRQQALDFDPLLISVADEELVAVLAESLPARFAERIVWGVPGNCQVAALSETDMTVSAIVGSAGLEPTLAAVEAGKDVALANKETLVMAGRLVMAAVQRNAIRLLPVDSEHSAIAQALEAGRKEDVAKIILTASGGPFLDYSIDALKNAAPAEALNHPNWDMGRKISIDSATLMNKGLEVIEARWLFDMDMDTIEVLVHRQSIVHSLVEFVDGSVVAQLGIPDMRVPISYALAYPERLPIGLSRLNLSECRDLSFQPPDTKRFPCLGIAYQAGLAGGCMPAVLNAANEIAVAAYLAERIRFPEIARVVEQTLETCQAGSDENIDAILAADRLARSRAQAVVEKIAV